MDFYWFEDSPLMFTLRYKRKGEPPGEKEKPPWAMALIVSDEALDARQAEKRRRLFSDVVAADKAVAKKMVQDKKAAAQRSRELVERLSRKQIAPAARRLAPHEIEDRRRFGKKLARDQRKLIERDSGVKLGEGETIYQTSEMVKAGERPIVLGRDTKTRRAAVEEAHAKHGLHERVNLLDE